MHAPLLPGAIGIQGRQINPQEAGHALGDVVLGGQRLEVAVSFGQSIWTQKRILKGGARCWSILTFWVKKWLTSDFE